MPNPYTGNNLPDQIQGFLSLIPGTRQNKDWRERSALERQATIEQARGARDQAAQQNQIFELAKSHPEFNVAMSEALQKHLGTGLTRAQIGHTDAQTALTGAEIPSTQARTAGQLEQNKGYALHNAWFPKQAESEMKTAEAGRQHLGAQTEGVNLANQWYPAKAQSELDSEQSQRNLQGSQMGLIGAQTQASQYELGNKGWEDLYGRLAGYPTRNVQQQEEQQRFAQQQLAETARGRETAGIAHVLGAGVIPATNMEQGSPDAKGRIPMVQKPNPMFGQAMGKLGFTQPPPAPPSEMHNAAMQLMQTLQQKRQGAAPPGGQTPGAATTNPAAGAVSPQANLTPAGAQPAMMNEPKEQHPMFRNAQPGSPDLGQLLHKFLFEQQPQQIDQHKLAQAVRMMKASQGMQGQSQMFEPQLLHMLQGLTTNGMSPTNEVYQALTQQVSPDAIAKVRALLQHLQ